MDLLQEYVLVPLDIFLKIPHNEISKLDAWLYFIASDKLSDIKKVCEAYPQFRSLYREVFKFRFQPKELVSMFSDALRLLDEGTAQLMIDEMRKEVEEAKAALKEAMEGRNAELQEKDAELQEKDAELQEKDAELQEKDEKLQKLNAELERLRNLLKLNDIDENME